MDIVMLVLQLDETGALLRLLSRILTDRRAAPVALTAAGYCGVNFGVVYFGVRLLWYFGFGTLGSDLRNQLNVNQFS
jgi:hypothetical protein